MDLGRVCGLHQCLLAHWNNYQISIHNENLIAFLPYFHGENMAAFRVRCIMACIMLSLPSFRNENKAGRCHILTAKIQQSFALDVPQHTGRVSCLCIQHAEAYQSTKHVMRVVYTGKLMPLANIDRSNHMHGRSCTQ